MNVFSKLIQETNRIGAESAARDGLLATISRLEPDEACAKLASTLAGLSRQRLTHA